MEKEFYLKCKRLWFFSPTDEDIFFEWVKTIPAIYKIDGELDEEHLYVRNTSLSDKDLQEIISLFRRYKIDRKQLKVFLTDDNKHWLAKWVK